MTPFMKKRRISALQGRRDELGPRGTYADEMLRLTGGGKKKSKKLSKSHWDTHEV